MYDFPATNSGQVVLGVSGTTTNDLVSYSNTTGLTHDSGIQVANVAQQNTSVTFNDVTVNSVAAGAHMQTVIDPGGGDVFFDTVQGTAAFDNYSAASPSFAWGSTPASSTSAMLLFTNGNLSLAGQWLILRSTFTPASSSATGTTGSIAWDSTYLYVCIATNTWVRTLLTTF